jgi:hypothetical protein
LLTELLWEQVDVLTASYDLPAGRRRDFRWLQRNLGIRNSDKESFEEVCVLLREIARRSDESEEETLH